MNKYVEPPYSQTKIFAARVSRGRSSFWSISAACAQPQQRLRPLTSKPQYDTVTDYRQTDGRTLDRFMTLTACYADRVITIAINNWPLIRPCTLHAYERGTSQTLLLGDYDLLTLTACNSTTLLPKVQHNVREAACRDSWYLLIFSEAHNVTKQCNLVPAKSATLTDTPRDALVSCACHGLAVQAGVWLRATETEISAALWAHVGGLGQICAWVHFVWPDPTQTIIWLTQPDPTQCN